MDYLRSIQHDQPAHSQHLPSSSTFDRVGVSNRPSSSSLAWSEQTRSTDNLILQSLPREVFESLRPYLRRFYVRKEQFLFQQDDEIDVVYFPETAVVSDLHILDDGRMVEIAMTGREGSIGVASLYQSGCRVANCVQVTLGGNILKIESSLLEKVSRLHPTLPEQLHTSLESYIRQISKKAVCNMYHTVAERFCTWLLMVNDRYPNKKLKLTHEQIARVLGVYRPSVTCIALNMRKENLIDYSRGQISISDRDQLEDRACQCYSELEHQSLGLNNSGFH